MNSEPILPIFNGADLLVFCRESDVHNGVHQRTQPTAANCRGQTVPWAGETTTPGAQVQRETMRGAVSTV